MILGKKHTTVRDYIIEYLAEGSQDINAIHRHIRKYRSITRPAIYNQINKLLEDEILLKNMNRYFLNREWIQKVRNLLNSFDVPVLKEGESVSYSFKDVHQADAYWKHLSPSYNALLGDVPIFIYNPHCFWVYLPKRKESEESYYRKIEENKQKLYLVIGGATELDMRFKKKYQGKHFKINVERIPTIKDTQHITVMGDIILELKFPNEATKKIDRLYQADKLTEHEIELGIEAVVYDIKKVRFTIERNQAKAQLLRERLSRNFLVR